MSRICGEELSWFDEEKGELATCQKEFDSCLTHNKRLQKKYGRKFSIISFEQGSTKDTKPL